MGAHGALRPPLPFGHVEAVVRVHLSAEPLVEGVAGVLGHLTAVVPAMCRQPADLTPPALLFRCHASNDEAGYTAHLGTRATLAGH